MTLEDKRRALGLLRIEVENLRKHGFAGLLCLGTGANPRFSCRETCPLRDLAPLVSQDEENPCRHIPLNKQGETVAGLAERRSKAYLEEQLLAWMEQAALRFENELWQESDPRYQRGTTFPE